MEAKKPDKVEQQVCEGLIVRRLNNGQIEASLHYSELSVRDNTVEGAIKGLAERAHNVLDLPQWYGHCDECNTDYSLTETGMYQCECGTFLSPE